MRAYLLVLLIAAAVSYLCTPMARGLAQRLRAYTPLRSRDVHTSPVPKMGGLAMFAAVAVSLVIAAQMSFLQGIFSDTRPIWGVVGAAVVVLLVGMADDLWDIHWLLKLSGQIAAGAVLAANGIRLEALPLVKFTIESPPVQIALTIFLVVLTMNAINFVDGLDGLAAGVAVIGGGAFFLYTYTLTRTINEFDYSNTATLIMAVLIGSCLGFLPHNFYPARIFMGDAGAMLIGLLLAAAAIAVTGDVQAVQSTRFRNVPAYMPILLPIAVISLPLLDLLLAVVRRTARGRSPFSADRGHLHHKLIDGGYSHPQAVLVMYLWTAVVALGSVLLAFFPWQVVLPIFVVLLVGAGYLTFHPARRRESRP